MDTKKIRVVAGIFGACLCLTVLMIWKTYYTGGGETSSVWYFLTLNYPVYAILDILNLTAYEPLVLFVLSIYWLILGFILTWTLCYFVLRLWDWGIVLVARK